MGSTVIIILTHVIMAFRVYALYQARRLILVSLGALIVVETILMTVKLYYQFGNHIAINTNSDLPHPLIVNCIFSPEFNSALTTFYWSIPILIDTIVFWLTLRKCRQFFTMIHEEKKPPLVLIFWWSFSVITQEEVSLLKSLMLDGLLYYLAFIFIHALNLALILRAPVTIKTIAAGFTQVFCCIFISRLLFNLRNSQPQSPSEVVATQRTNIGHFTSVYDFFNSTWSSRLRNRWKLAILLYLPTEVETETEVERVYLGADKWYCRMHVTTVNISIKAIPFA